MASNKIVNSDKIIALSREKPSRGLEEKRAKFSISKHENTTINQKIMYVRVNFIFPI